VLRYKHVESPSDSGVSWHGVWVDQFGNLYRRTLIYHPGFWNFVLRAEELKGMRMEALKFYLNKPTETGDARLVSLGTQRAGSLTLRGPYRPGRQSR
jgi:hypothetical protein